VATAATAGGSPTMLGFSSGNLVAAGQEEGSGSQSPKRVTETEDEGVMVTPVNTGLQSLFRNGHTAVVQISAQASGSSLPESETPPHTPPRNVMSLPVTPSAMQAPGSAPPAAGRSARTTGEGDWKLWSPSSWRASSEAAQQLSGLSRAVGDDDDASSTTSRSSRRSVREVNDLAAAVTVDALRFGF
jgi:hypothetical protein